MRAVRATIVAVAAAVACLCGGAGTAGAGAPDGERQVALQAAPTGDARGAPVQVVDRLRAGDLLDVFVGSGVQNARGVVRQCTRTIDEFTGCVNSYPVQFGDGGNARFLYRLTDPGDCGPQGSCVLVVGDIDGERLAVATLVFGAPAPPPPAVAIVPAGTTVRSGDTVQVEVARLVAGARVRVGYCDPICAGAETRRADAEGQLTASVVIGEDCDRCGIAVVGSAHDTLVRVPFAAGPQLGYDTQRLVLGLLVAAVLLAAAWRIIAAVDWRPPSEAATPELDAWEL